MSDDAVRPPWQSKWEPSCIHSDNLQQPASACRICKNSDKLKAWVTYWDWVRALHREEIPAHLR